MALQAQNIPVKMTVGIDEKSDPKSLQTKLTILQNASFQSPGQIKKRDGFQALYQSIIGGGSISNGQGLATFQNELNIMDGSNFYSYSTENQTNVNKGQMTPVQLQNVNPIIRNIYSQSQPDSAYDPITGLKCYVYMDSGSGGLNYSVEDSNTGTFIVSNAILNASATLAKVMVIGNYFVIVYHLPASGLVYAFISTSTPAIITTGVLINSQVPSTRANFDCVVTNGNLYISYQNTFGHILTNTLSPTLVLSAPYDAGAYGFSIYFMGIAADAASNIWITFGAGIQTSNSITVVNSSLTTTVLPITSFDSTNYLANSTLTITGTIATIFGEVNQSPTYTTNNHANYINKYQMTLAGTLTPGTLLMKGVGLASKAILYNGNSYLLSVYDGCYQTSVNSSAQTVVSLVSIEPTYFLLNQSGQIQMKLAPELAGSYYTLGILPEIVNLGSGQYSLAYLLEERTTAVNGVVTFQTGAQYANFSFMPSYPAPKLQFGSNLHIGSGQLWMYDGQNIVEHGFHIYPENLINTAIAAAGGIGIGASTSTVNQVQYCSLYEWVDNQGQTHQSAPSIPITVNLPMDSTLTAISNVGSTVAGSNIITLPGAANPGTLFGQVYFDATTSGTFPAGTYLVGYSNNMTGLNMIMSQQALTTVTSHTFSTYDVSRISVQIPTLRQTNKKLVSIVLYRTENNGTIFYRVTSPNNPAGNNALTFNDPTVDFIVITDVLPDAEIIGNEQLYTTGGELENIAAPAISALCTFKNRMIYLSPENPFQWGYSKQVLTGVPVEFNSLEFVENIDQQIGFAKAVQKLDDKLIFFGPTSKYYVVGQGPTPSGAQNDFSDATRIAGISGCSNPDSVVEIPTGLMYQDSVKGIYLLDRSLTESYIGADVEAYNGFTVTSVQKFETQNKVKFTLSNGVNLVYDWYVSQWEIDPFAIPAVDSTVFENDFTYLQANGLVLQQTPGVFSDNGNVIPMQLQSGWISPAGLEGFGRIWELQIMGTYYSPHTLTVTLYNDFSMTPSQIVTIPVLSNPGQYQFRIKLKVQKCESIMINITETQAG